ncbi:MAG: SIMPL domain-containing protein [Elainella sp. C42_A2020_010]|nr:SIMPL domain-containing protein [Elainella sp. C42_A2020_010]
MKLARSLRSLMLVSCLAFPVMITTSLAASPVLAQQEQIMRTLTVTGQGKESVAATLTQVQLGVEVQAKTAEEAQQEAARRSTAVVEFLRSRNVDKLQTTGISLNPRYDYANNRQQIIGYSATNTVSFRVPTDRAGNLLDDAVAAGATRIDSVSFVADDAAVETARQQAIQEAIQNAQVQANTVLSSLGLTQQEIVGIQVNGAAPPPPILYRANMDAMAQAASAPETPIVGGEQEVEASVTLQIRY